MVLSSPTPWSSLPFITSISTGSNSSSPSSISSPSPQHSTIPSLSPATCKPPGSVLGLKSACSLSKPPSSIAHLDLHTHSLPRRFIEAIVSDSPLHYPTNKTRSAGSFRLDESFSWVNKDKELACYEEKPFCAMPSCTSTNASVVPIRAGRFSFEEKPIYEMPWCTSTGTHDALIGAGKFNREGKPISVMPIDAPIVPTKPSKSNNAEIPISIMACSASIDTPAVPIRAANWNNEENPISAMPCSSLCEASEAVPIRACRFNVELEGDLTAADVDLLPMPGLVSLASPLYESYLSVSPTDSRMTRISSSDYVSTANSTSNSSSKVAPNYLGLPPEFLQEVDGKLASCKVPVTSREEQDLGCPSMRGSSACVEALPLAFDNFAAVSNSAITNSYPVVEDDNFAESQSLAGLWSNHDAIHCDTDSALHGSEGLASILTDLPQKQHAGMAQSGHCNIMDVESCLGSEFIMDHELDYLMMAGKADASGVGVSEYVTPKGLQQGLISASSAISAKEGHFVAGHCKLEMEVHSVGEPNATLATSVYPHFEGKGGSSSLVAGPCESSQGSSIVAPRMPLLSSAIRPNVSPQYLANCNQSMCAASMPMSMEREYIPNGPASMMIGKKRPFPVYDHLPPGLIPLSGGMFNPNIPHVLACPSNAIQQDNPESKAAETSYSLATQAFSAMLYKAQGGGAAHTRLNWAASQMNDTGEGIKPPPSKARRRHGTAMDPQSIAARTRREKFSDRIRILQSLVPNGERLDTVSMLGQTLEYVRFLQHQVWQLYHGMDPSSNIKCEKWKDFLEPAQPAAT